MLQRVKDAFKAASEAEANQRDRERDDLRFQVPELQWSEEAKRQRMGLSNDGVPTPARPMLSIPKLDQPIQLVVNQQRNAHLGVKIQPLSPDADDEVAEILQGLYRSIERDSNAHIARSWAFDRAVKAGRGFYRVNTKYDDRGGHPFDHVITIDRILNQESVYFDPSATKSDFSDAEWAIITSWVPIKTFERLFPKSKSPGMLTDETFLNESEESPQWVRGEGDHEALLVAEFFYKEHAESCLCLLESGEVVSEDMLPEGVEPRSRRFDDSVSVKWAKVTGSEVLEEGEWNGKHIPIIPVIGKELQPFDSDRRFVGIIGPAKDAQRLYNFSATSAIEMAALEPKAPWIMAEGQDEGWEAEWQQSNIRNIPALHYKPTSLGDKQVPPPARAQVDVGRLGPSMMLLQQADTFIQGSTATYDPSLGRTNQKEQSGKAITALQQQADAGTSHYLASLADVSMPYEAAVILDLLPAIYDRPGRLARTLDTEDDTEMVMLNQPFILDPKTKRPVAVQAQFDQEGHVIQPQGASNAPEIKHYDLRKGVYSVAVSIGRSRNTLMQEGADEMSQILQAAPQLMPLLGPIYFKFRDFPGAAEIAEMLSKLRDKQFPGLSGGDEEAGISPGAAQAQVQAMQQQLQIMQQQLQAAVKAIEADQAKQMAMLQKAQMDNETKAQVASQDNQTKIVLEEMKLRFEALQRSMDRKHELGSGQLQRDHEKEENDQKFAHEIAVELAPKPQPPLKEPLERDKGV